MQTHSPLTDRECAELDALLRGYGYEPLSVAAVPGTPSEQVHRATAAALDEALERIAAAQRAARARRGGPGVRAGR